MLIKRADSGQGSGSIIQNAKTSRPSVCNAMEVLLVHEAIADDFLPQVKKALVDEAQVAVEMRLDAQAQQIIAGTPASVTDFDTEFLDYVMAVKGGPFCRRGDCSY